MGVSGRVSNVHPLPTVKESQLCARGREQIGCGNVMRNMSELPRQVFGIVHAAAHALIVEWWHLMGCDARKKNGSVAESIGGDAVKPVGSNPVDLQLIWGPYSPSSASRNPGPSACSRVS